MFRLFDMIFAARRMALAEEAARPWTCPECGRTATAGEARRHRATHRTRTLSDDPLVVELRCRDAERDLGPAIAELRRRWPGRRFQFVGGASDDGMLGGGPSPRTLIAIEDARDGSRTDS